MTYHVFASDVTGLLLQHYDGVLGAIPRNTGDIRMQIGSQDRSK